MTDIVAICNPLIITYALGYVLSYFFLIVVPPQPTDRAFGAETKDYCHIRIVIDARPVVLVHKVSETR